MSKRMVLGWLIVLSIALLAASIILTCLEHGRISSSEDETPVVTAEDLKAEMKRLEEVNAYPNNEKISPEDYPRMLGRYSENGLVLIEKYYCSDVCPANARIVIVFQNVSKEECGTVGGKELTDPAWGGYIGCAPVVG